MLEYLLIGLGLGFPAAAQPGPFQAYLLTQTLKNGWRQTLPAALAPLISDGPIILLVLLVLTRLPEELLIGLQLAGGLFLLYLAWRAWLNYRHYRPIIANTAADRQSLREAALLNFLSPNPYIFWSTIAGPLLLTAWLTSPWYAVAFLIGFYGALIGGFAIFVLLFGYVGGLSDRLGRVLAALSAVALAFFGVFQIIRALQFTLN
jgi:threonine/homoserine/homoserine lactone efflux protein